jgi:hypothetical protein
VGTTSPDRIELAGVEVANELFEFRVVGRFRWRVFRLALH